MNKIIYRLHTIERMFQRDISEAMVKKAIYNGKIIEKYLDDKPYPSFLVLGFDKNIPIHVVYAKNENDEFVVITVYEPDTEKWDKSFKIRIL